VSLRIRQAVRAIVLAPDPAVLLVRFEFPTATVWAPPGGGIEPGESAADALRRELHEEAGLVGPDIGPEVWHRTHIVPFIDGSHDGQHDRYFVVPVPAGFTPQPTLSWAQLRAEYVHELAWWTPAELVAAEGAVFAPRALPMLVADLVAHGPPPEPIDVGV
jgi:ADP-ribose pyrophosphatase YjhB (NUDIX family)